MKKNRTSKRLPAIVPRFIKNAVAIGTIPVLSSGCFPSAPPVVATYSHRPPKQQRPVQPTPVDAAQPTPEVQPVVAAMMPSPVVAAVIPHPPPPADAGVDAPAPKQTKKPAKAAKPPPPPPRPDIYGVAAMFAPDPRGELLPEQDLEVPRKPNKP